jgi:hypothetical protein
MTDPKEGFPNEGGAIPVVTSHGSKRHTGVVWVVTRPDNTGFHLRVYDAEDLTQPHLFDAVIGTSCGAGLFVAVSVQLKWRRLRRRLRPRAMSPPVIPVPRSVNVPGSGVVTVADTAA